MVNSSKKGGRGEKELVELCKKWWGSNDFMRSPDSGGMSTVLESVGAPADLVGRLAGDLLVPTDFPFCIESKRYAEVNLYSVMTNPENNIIKQWWEQCSNDAKRAAKIPLLSFREDKRKRFVVIGVYDYEDIGGDTGGKGWFECMLADTHVRILLWEDFVKMFPRESFKK